MCEIVLNIEGWRGSKAIVYQVLRRPGGTGTDDYVVSKQFTSSPLTDDVQWVDRAKPFYELRVNREELQKVLSAVERVTLPKKRTEEFGCDGTWYVMRIRVNNSDRVIHWWSDIEPELQSVYKLRDALVETVNRLLRSPK
jgi:hypothetical protein